MNTPCVTIAAAALCLLAGPLHAQDADQPAPPAGPLILKARPEGVYFSQRLQFDEDGSVDESRHFQADFSCEVPPGLNAVSYEVVKVLAVTTGGARFTPSVKGQRDAFAPGDDQRFSVQLDLTNTPAADKLRRVEGRVTLRVGEGPVRKAVIGPFKNVIGRRVKIAEFPELTLGFARQDEGLAITFTGEQGELYQNASFLSADGVELLSESWNNGWDEGGVQHYFRVGMPDDGQIVLSFWSSIKDVPAEFTVENVPLPSLRHADDPGDLVFNVEPLDAAEAARALPAGDLGVVIE